MVPELPRGSRSRCPCGRSSGINSLAAFSIIYIYSFQTVFVFLPWTTVECKIMAKKCFSPLTHHIFHLHVDTLQKKNDHVSDNSKTSITPRKEESPIHEEEPDSTGRHVEYFFTCCLFSYPGNFIHNGSFSDHLTSMLKTPTFFCPLSSSFIYRIVYLVFFLEHFKDTINSI